MISDLGFLVTGDSSPKSQTTQIRKYIYTSACMYMCRPSDQKHMDIGGIPFPFSFTSMVDNVKRRRFRGVIHEG